MEKNNQPAQADIEMGQGFWRHISEPFRETLLAGLPVEARARVWAGFIGAMNGALLADLGRADALAVLGVTAEACSQFARSKEN
jgi:hypothetical protein